MTILAAAMPKFPAGMTILEAISRGLLPAQIQVLNAGVGKPSQTVAKLLSTGAINPGTFASSLVFATPYPTYGGH